MTKKKPPEELQKTGRKSTYTEEMGERICRELANGRTITSICAEDWAPSVDGVFGWLNKFPPFAEAYARAREAQQEVFAAQIIDIAATVDDPAKARNMIDARKWHAAKVAPKKWGDRVEIDAKIEHNSGPSEGLTMMLAMLEKAGNGGRH
jgi:hypothetical protein